MGNIHVLSLNLQALESSEVPKESQMDPRSPNKKAWKGFRPISASQIFLGTVFPHIVSAETILFWIWKSKDYNAKGHNT